MEKMFARFANATARATGSPIAFLLCVALVVIWAASGPLFKFSETWQLVINTGTTIITFLMVFLIQNTQNRDSNALHAKLDELIRVSSGHNGFIGIENLPDDELEAILAECDRHSPKLRLEAVREAHSRSARAAAESKPNAKPAARRAPARAAKSGRA
jgi:low affinity Fe/Cu permease